MIPDLKSVHYVLRYDDGDIVEFVDTFESLIVECREYPADPTSSPSVRGVTLTYMVDTLGQAREFGIDHCVFYTWE